MIYFLNFFLMIGLLIAFKIRFISSPHRFIFSGFFVLTIIFYNAIPYVDRDLTNLNFIARQFEAENKEPIKKIDEKILREDKIGILGRNISIYDNIIKLSFPSRLNSITQYSVEAAYFIDNGRVEALSFYMVREGSYFFSGFSTATDTFGGSSYVSEDLMARQSK